MLGRADRPGQRDAGSATAQLDADVWGRRTAGRRQRHRHEGGNLHICAGGMGQSAPFVHDVGVDAVRERHAGHRCTGLGALGQDLLLEIGAVAPTGLVLGFGHGVHLSGLVDTIVAAYAAALKGGMTVRLRHLLIPCRYFQQG